MKFSPFLVNYIGRYGFAASRQGGHSFSLTPYLTPRRTPTGTPKMISAAGSPKRSAMSAAGSPKRSSTAVSPRGHSVSGSPTRRPYEGRVSSLPPTHHATAPNSPPHRRALPGILLNAIRYIFVKEMLYLYNPDYCAR